MLKNDFSDGLEILQTAKSQHKKYFASLTFPLYSEGYLFKSNVDKCLQLIREQHWFKTDTFNTFALDSKSSYERQLVWYGRILVSFSAYISFPTSICQSLVAWTETSLAHVLIFTPTLTAPQGLSRCLSTSQWVSGVHAGHSHGSRQ